MAALLRTKDRLLILAAHPGLFDVALQISRNLYQYFRADTEIVSSSKLVERHGGNVVHLACGSELAPSAVPSYPITVTRYGLNIRTARGVVRSYGHRLGLGAVLLRPLAEERTELVIWGFNGDGLRNAARLLPLLTGVGQPDFVVVNKECGWKGASGALAMGFLDSLWEVSGSSYIT